jgi:lambda family phage portal protein
MFNFFKKNTRQQEQSSAPKKRNIARAMSRMFSAASDNRFGDKWSGTPITADMIVSKNWRPLVARSREQVANNDYARGYMRMCRQNIVGHKGIMMQAQARKANGALDSAVNDAIEEAWFQWSKRENCDITGKMSLMALQKLAVTNAARDGEFIFRKIYGGDAGDWGFALQSIDPVRLPIDFDDDNPRTGSFIRHGIEYNSYGRPMAYYFSALTAENYDYSYGGRNYIRVPADQIIHGFETDFDGQKRGLPWMATGLFRMRQLMGMEDAAIINARVGASKMGFIEYEDGYGGDNGGEDIEIDVEAGEFQELPAGARLSKWEPQYPSGEFSPFVKHALRSFATGAGVNYNTLANDLEGVNFSSIRQGTLDEREGWKDRQEWLIEQLIQPIFDAWLPRALLSGRIKVRGKALRAEMIDKYSAVAWQGRRWTWIDPRADMDAAERSKNNLLQSPSRIIRENGNDPQEVYREIAADIAAMKEAGIPDDYIKLAMGQKIAPAMEGAPDNTADK